MAPAPYLGGPTDQDGVVVRLPPDGLYNVDFQGSNVLYFLVRLLPEGAHFPLGPLAGAGGPEQFRQRPLQTQTAVGGDTHRHRQVAANLLEAGVDLNDFLMGQYLPEQIRGRLV